jgi:hypothetical protein
MGPPPWNQLLKATATAAKAIRLIPGMSSGARFVVSISDISISQRSGTYHHRLSSLDHISSKARTSDSSTGRSCRYLTLLADMALGGEKVASSLDQIVAERGVPGSITDAVLRSFAKLTPPGARRRLERLSPQASDRH